ncbi:lipopolysaccharide transport periplasmic protein LptA [Providencia sp. SP181]|uniref:lipopolysaccharide transport periplasmic protein LptA n=1 Tax=Providencia sp. SP181 TaxID=3136277 RepID=UPI003D2D8053
MRAYFFILFLIAIFCNTSYSISNKYTIDSDSQLILSNGNIKSIGNVHAVSGDMIIKSDEATYHQDNPKNIFITAVGNPIKYAGITEDGKPFSGNSKKFKYIPKTGEMILIGEAFIQQNENTLSAELINYNVITKKMTASAAPNKRVRSVFYPEGLPQKK